MVDTYSPAEQRAVTGRLPPSMRIALEDLNFEQLVVLYPGPKAYTLAERVRVVPLSKLAESDARDLFLQPRKVAAKTAR